MVIVMEETASFGTPSSTKLFVDCEGGGGGGGDMKVSSPLSPTINSGALTIEELVLERDHAREQCKMLQVRVDEVQRRLFEQTEVNAELKRARQALSEEIMDLTKALFEEANGMVAAEAKARAHLEIARRKLQNELEATKEALRLEKAQLYELRGRFGGGGSHPNIVTISSRDCSPRESTSSNIFDSKRLATLLGDQHYFTTLLPRHRFDTRYRCDGPAGEIWDSLTQKLAETELSEFSRFVERSSTLNAEELLSHPYLRRICETDVAPCLHFEFKPKPFVRRVALAMIRNTCYIEHEPTFRSENILPTITTHSRTPSSHSDLSLTLPNDSDNHHYQIGGVTTVRSITASCPGSPGSNGKGSNQRMESPPTIESTQRFRGLVSHFATSVSSLPEALLANIGTSSSSYSNGPSPNSNSLPPYECPKFCALCGRPAIDSPSILKYRVRLTDSEPWMYIESSCRERLVAAGHFFTFLRHLKGGLYSNRPLVDLYYDMMHFRRYMFYTRLSTGAASFFLQADFEAYLDLIDAQLRSKQEEKIVKPKISTTNSSNPPTSPNDEPFSKDEEEERGMTCRIISCRLRDDDAEMNSVKYKCIENSDEPDVLLQTEDISEDDQILTSYLDQLEEVNTPARDDADRDNDRDDDNVTLTLFPEN